MGRSIVSFVLVDGSTSTLTDVDGIVIQDTFSKIPVIYFTEQPTHKLILLKTDKTPYSLAELQTYTGWDFAIAEDYNGATAPPVRTQTGITVAEETWQNKAGQDITGGVILIPVDANTTELQTILGTEPYIYNQPDSTGGRTITVGTELLGYIAPEVEPTLIVQYPFVFRNRRITSATPPGTVGVDYLTPAQIEALYVPLDGSAVSTGTALLGTDEMGVYDTTTGLWKKRPVSEVATGTQVAPTQNVYVDTTAMLADQGNQTEDYLQQAGTAFYKKELASTGSLSNYSEVGPQDAPIEGLYADTTTMIAGQVNQTANYIQKAGTSYYHYLGTTAGSIADYQLIGSGGGGGAVDDVFGRTGNVVAVSGDYNAGQITETSTAKILTDVERTAIDLTNYTTTGVITGGVVTENTSTTFDISAGTGVILDYTDPTAITKTLISWNAEIGVAIPDISKPFTLLSVSANNTIGKVSRGTTTTPQENRSAIQLQAVIHNSGVQIDNITHSYRPSFGVLDATLDYLEENGIINQGNLYKANGANVRLDRNSGTSTIPFINIIHDLQAPVTKTDNAEIAVLVTGTYQDGIGGMTLQAPVLDLDTVNFDNGSGTLAPLTNNYWVTHRLVFFSDGDVNGLQYGQNEYATSDDAINAIYTESFIASPLASSGSTTTYITLQEGETDFTNAIFTENKAGGGSGGATPTGVLTVSSGTDITVDNTDPQNPIVNFTGSAGGSTTWGTESGKTANYTILTGDEGNLIYQTSSTIAERTFTFDAGVADKGIIWIYNQSTTYALKVSDGTDDIITLFNGDGIYKFTKSTLTGEIEITAGA